MYRGGYFGNYGPNFCLVKLLKQRALFHLNQLTPLTYFFLWWNWTLMSGITCQCLYFLTLTHVRTIEFCISYNVFIESISIRSSCMFIKFEPALLDTVVLPTTEKMLNEKRRWTPVYDVDKCCLYMFEITGLSVCLFLILYSS